MVNNEIITKLSAQGEICIFAKTTTHLVIAEEADHQRIIEIHTHLWFAGAGDTANYGAC